MSGALWNLDGLPFHIGARPSATNAPHPDRLPFILAADGDVARLVQTPSDEVRTALDRVYEEGEPIGTPLAPTGLGAEILSDFLGFVREAAGPDTLAGRSVLEIGAGTGALLRAMASEGAEATGVEPGGVPPDSPPVIDQPFSAGLFDRRFDAVVHYAVLEHIEDPVAFLAEQQEVLEPGGVIVCSVPDCSTPIEHGDLSMLVHEHYSYFTAASLEAVGSRAGLRAVAARPAAVGGALYVAWQRDGTPDGPVADDQPERYVEQARETLRRLAAHAAPLAASGQTLGIWCPARFVNYHALLDGPLPALRGFDDDPNLTGAYFPPLPFAVEDRGTLGEASVDEVLVASWSFGERIAASLREEPALNGTRVLSLADLL